MIRPPEADWVGLKIRALLKTRGRLTAESIPHSSAKPIPPGLKQAAEKLALRRTDHLSLGALRIG
jgi:hypothetical protein